jgi:hypothetical protein
MRGILAAAQALRSTVLGTILPASRWEGMGIKTPALKSLKRRESPEQMAVSWGLRLR